MANHLEVSHMTTGNAKLTKSIMSRKGKTIKLPRPMSKRAAKLLAQVETAQQSLVNQREKSDLAKETCVQHVAKDSNDVRLTTTRGDVVTDWS